jgi:hypothetical protein
MSTPPDDPYFDDKGDFSYDETAHDALYEDSKEIVDAIFLIEEALPKIEDPVGVYITLFDLYNEIEHIEEAGAALVQAAQRIGPDDHSDLTFFLYNQLELFSQLNSEAQFAYERLGHLIAEDEGSLDANTVHLDQRKLFQVDLIPELLLANHLLRMHALSDAEYAVCIQDLCWHSSGAQTTPRSLLFVLEDRGLPHREKAIEFLAHDASTPYLDLKLIHFDPDLLEVLPPEFCQRRAACVIGEVGGEPMIAILNPYNMALKEDVARLIDSEPHYFLASAEGYQHFLNQQSGMLEE